MRQVGTLSREPEAQRFADHLTTKGISALAEEDSEGWVIWIREENQLEQAREEFDKFRINPEEECYKNVSREAEEIRNEAIKQRMLSAKNVVDMRGHWQRPVAKKAPLVIVMIALSVLVTLMTNFGGNKNGVFGRLTICQVKDLGNGQIEFPRNGLKNILEGQIWRLVTPIFIHFEIYHIVFNMFCFYAFGVQIEERRGTWRLALIILSIAIISNLGQFLIPHQLPPYPPQNPLFGGMSGVVYGLFGYLWMKTLYDPSSGMFVSQSTIFILMGWFFICLFGIRPGVANGAHAVGLVMGIAIGIAPVLLKSSRHS